MFNFIKDESDIQYFLEQTNSLHDGYITSVEYVNDTVTNRDGDGFYINSDATRLVIRILVTSICDTVTEIVFDNLWKWQIKYTQMDITDTFIKFDEKNRIVWSDNVSELENGSYAIAETMKWRIVE